MRSQTRLRRRRIVRINIVGHTIAVRVLVAARVVRERVRTRHARIVRRTQRTVAHAIPVRVRIKDQTIFRRTLVDDSITVIVEPVTKLRSRLNRSTNGPPVTGTFRQPLTGPELIGLLTGVSRESLVKDLIARAEVGELQ